MTSRFRDDHTAADTEYEDDENCWNGSTQLSLCLQRTVNCAESITLQLHNILLLLLRDLKLISCYSFL